MRSVVLLASLLVTSSAVANGQERLSLLFRGGMVVDGTGSPPRQADVGIRGGRIVAIGQLTGVDASRIIDARGHVIAPGFIDAHAHADASATRHGKAENFLRMGVTTIVTGNCGSSASNLEAHFTQVAKAGISLNYGSLIGHGTVRRTVMGTAKRLPTAAELDRMKAAIDQAMRAGAQGMSTGLIYVPGTYAATEELVALSRIVARHGGVYASHMRNEEDQVIASIEEAILIGRNAGCRVHLSHLKASGRNNWGRGKHIVTRLEKARAEGLRVTGDQYAYTASSTSIDVLFPAEELQVTRGKFGLKLKQDSAFRARMEQELLKTMDRMGFGDLSYCRIAAAPNNTNLSGMTLDQVAQQRLGKKDRESQARITVDLYIESKGRRISMVYHKMDEGDVETIMRAPFVGVACDAGIRVRGTARPHPRGAGNNARVLSRYVRERKVIPLELAIRKMTGLPAEVFELKDRGVIRIGSWADLTVFHPDQIADKATYDAPYEAPTGIPWVVVNGVLVVDAHRHLGTRPGQVLRRRSTLAPR